MKQGIHPDYQIANVHCSCGNTFQTRSTVSEIRAEICSACHPFYTGKQKLVDTGGRVERFQRRYAKTQPAQEWAAPPDDTAEPSNAAARPATHRAGPFLRRPGRHRGRDDARPPTIGPIAVRRPSGEIHLESHEIDSVASGFRSSGSRPARHHRARPGPGDRHPGAHGRRPRVGRGRGAALLGADGLSHGLAIVLFIGIFILGAHRRCSVVPAPRPRDASSRTCSRACSASAVPRLPVLIGRTKEIRRVFQYHGAEHKTIAAYEHDEPLVPEPVDRFSTLHVRCGTNFLLIVMIVTIFVFTLFGTPGLLWRICRDSSPSRDRGALLRGVAPGRQVSGLHRDAGADGAGELAAEDHHPAPDHGQIEVAIASFNEVLRAEREGAAPTGTT